MTDLVSDTSSGTDDTQETDHILPGLLVLTGDFSETIYIKAKPDNQPTYSAYGLTRHGDFYKGGISWQNGGDFGKFITFHFLPGVKSVECDGLPYSPVSAETQQLCILPVAPASYPFTVFFTPGGSHDPQIVVTPPSLPDPTA